MSQENVELVWRLNELFNRGEFESMFALADAPPEFEFVPSGVLIPDLADVQRGPEGLRRVMEVFMREFDDPHVEHHEVIDAGDQVFFSSTIRGRGNQSGVETSWEVFGVVTVQDGRLVRWQGFTDRDAALAAAGLGE